MRMHALLSGIFTFLLLTTPAGATTFTGLYAFGDSLTTTGNTPTAAPYTPGRFSNGDIWIDDVAAHLGLPIVASNSGGTNYASGGATTSTVLNTQIAAFSSDVGGVADSNALYAVWAGGNDGLGFGSPSGAAQNIGQSILDLAALGAMQFLVPNLPDLSLTPGQLGNPFASAFSNTFNSTLTSVLAGLPSNLTVFTVDVAGLTDDIAANPAAFGFTNVSSPCFTGIVCATPDTYAFWDTIHPTSQAHNLIGALAINALPVPEPGQIALVALAVFAASRRSRRFPA